MVFASAGPNAMSQFVAEAGAPIVLEHYDQLVAYFEAACKPRATWRIGTEYEKVAVWAADGTAVPFTGGIEEVLRRLADGYAWHTISENGRVIALQGEDDSITLEPGGQLELSGAQYENIHQAEREFA